MIQLRIAGRTVPRLDGVISVLLRFANLCKWLAASFSSRPVHLYQGEGKSKRPLSSGMARNRAAKHGCTYPIHFCNYDVIEFYWLDIVEIGLCSLITAKAKTRSNGSTERSACVAVAIGLAPVCCRK